MNDNIRFKYDTMPPLHIVLLVSPFLYYYQELPPNEIFELLNLSLKISKKQRERNILHQQTVNNPSSMSVNDIISTYPTS